MKQSGIVWKIFCSECHEKVMWFSLVIHDSSDFFDYWSVGHPVYTCIQLTIQWKKWMIFFFLILCQFCTPARFVSKSEIFLCKIITVKFSKVFQWKGFDNWNLSMLIVCIPVFKNYDSMDQTESTYMDVW